ncbi:MAG: transaldolase [Thermosipho sp. (in: Bacteria)]|nr:transaldolase [Thermosipho sp. (in: thermotogales)]
MIFIDSISSNAIELISKNLFFEGLTTNPTILKKNNISFETALQLLYKVRGTHFVQISLRNKRYLNYLMEKSFFSDKIVVKLPWVPLEISDFVRKLRERRYKICATAVYSFNQIVSALTLDVEYIAIYYSRMLKCGYKKEYIKELLTIFPYPEKFLVASLKTVDDINEVIKMGYKNITIDEKLALEFFKVKFPNNDLERFEKDFKEELS